MANEIRQEGIANIAIQDAENITVNITQQLVKSVEYNNLLEQLETLQELYTNLPENKIEKRINVSKKIPLHSENMPRTLQ